MVRQLCIDLSKLATQMMGTCSPKTCPEMKASEWVYLCSNHTSPSACSAIDYILHTIDSAWLVLTSNKVFPSRVSIAAGSASQHLSALARRLYRVFAHAWFSHRDIFIDFEVLPFYHYTSSMSLMARGHLVNNINVHSIHRILPCLSTDAGKVYLFLSSFFFFFFFFGSSLLSSLDHSARLPAIH